MPTRCTIAGSRTIPEDIARQRSTPFCVGTDDGTVFRGGVGKPTTEVFLPDGREGRTSATGLKTDDVGRLIVGGGATGKAFVHDIRTRALLHVYGAGRGDAHLNDVALARDGSVHLSDSARPVLWHITAAEPASGGPVHQPPEVGVGLVSTTTPRAGSRSCGFPGGSPTPRSCAPSTARAWTFPRRRPSTARTC
ncbi:hypothetical protein AB0H94_34330 [Streptomyces purpurascens]|uniref:hypothetical protein n=1 Tax=Streptomyces purpurascens TaxID=1924 RepID=UPI0033D6341C